MRAINLLPRDDVRRAAKPPNTVVLVAVIGGVLVTALLCGGFLLAHGKVTRKHRDLQLKQEELRAVPVPARNELQAQTQFAAAKKARVTALSAALAHRVAWDRVLREFALVLPDDVWLLNLSAKAPVASGVASTAASAPASSGSTSGTTVAAPATGFQIEGYTYSHAAVARLLTRLAVVPDLTNVQLQSSETAKLAGQKIVHFRIAADVRDASAGGAPSS
jgi:Tfp pilus assembly protein PilN